MTDSKSLFQEFDVTDQDIQDILGDTEDSRLAVAGVFLANVIEELESENDISYIENITFGLLYAQNWWKIGGCAKQALGLDLIDDFRDLRTGYKKLKKKARKRLMNKFILKVVGKV